MPCPAHPVHSAEHHLLLKAGHTMLRAGREESTAWYHYVARYSQGMHRSILTVEKCGQKPPLGLEALRPRRLPELRKHIDCYHVCYNARHFTYFAAAVLHKQILRSALAFPKPLAAVAMVCLGRGNIGGVLSWHRLGGDAGMSCSAMLRSGWERKYPDGIWAGGSADWLQLGHCRPAVEKVVGREYSLLAAIW